MVHMASGWTGLVGSYVVGPRTEGKGTPAQVPYVMLGTALLWFGWIGFNAGSALTAGPLAAQAFLTTNTATAASMVMWIIMDYLQVCTISLNPAMSRDLTSCACACHRARRHLPSGLVVERLLALWS